MASKFAISAALASAGDIQNNFREAAGPITDGFVGKPHVQCNRIRQPWYGDQFRMPISLQVQISRSAISPQSY